jgi:hypothetical protein
MDIFTLSEEVKKIDFAYIFNKEWNHLRNY